MLAHGWKEKLYYQEYFPWTSQVLWYQNWGLRVGGQQLMAFLTAVMRNELSFDSLVPCLAVGTMLTGCGMLRFSSCIFNNYVEKKDKRVIAEIIICLIASFNMFLYYDPLYGFYPMTLGNAYFLLTISELMLIVSQGCKRINVVWGTVYACCLAITYSELLPFLMFQVILLLIYKICAEKKVWNEFTKGIILIGASAAILLNVYILDMIRAVLLEMQDQVGEPRQFGLLEYSGYVLGICPMFYSFHTKGAPITKIVYLFSITGWGIWLFLLMKKYLMSKKLIELAGAYLPFVFMLIYFNFFAPNWWAEGTGNSYSVYKTLRYLVLLIFPWIAIILNQAFYYSKKPREKMLIFIYMIVMVTISGKDILQNYCALQRRNAQIIGKEKDDNFAEYYKLREKYSDKDRVINLVGLPDEHARLITYFLKDCKIAYPYSTDIFHRKWVDKDPPYDESGLTLLYKPSSDSIAGLIEMPDKYCEIVLEDGFYSKEQLQNGEEFCWSKRRSSFSVQRPIAIGESVKVNLQIFPAYPNQEAQIFIYDDNSSELLKIIDVEFDMEGFATLEFELDMGKSLGKKLNLEFEGEVNREEGVAGRELAYMILLNDDIEYALDVGQAYEN